MTITLSIIKKNIQKFQEWLSERGAQVFAPTNEYELIRFKSGEETSIIYRKKSGDLTFVGSAKEAFEKFRINGDWRAIPATKRRKNGTSHEIRFLLKRDGDRCFFCNGVMTTEDISREHLIAITHGGPDHVSNIVLAHNKCNQRAGHLSLIEKINIHVNARINK